METIFKAYDIRGLYPSEIDESAAGRIGYAFATYLHRPRIVLGRDVRRSSPSLCAAFLTGARAGGASVLNIGPATTPMLYTAVIDTRCDGGAMITASHLPAVHNGIKLCREQAIPLSGADGLPEVEAIYRRCASLPTGAPAAPHQCSYLARYIETLRSFARPDVALRVVADAGNGMGGLDTPGVIAHLTRATLIPMYMEPDGQFPHHIPNPLAPENTRELQARVIAEGADFGVAFDGDADRAGFVDERGTRVPADLVLALFAEYFLERVPRATVLYDLRASHAVPEHIRELGGHAIETRVGHSFIKKEMRSTNAVLAGELSGHYYFRDAGFIDSGIVALLTLMNLLWTRRKSLSELIGPLRRYARSDELSIPVANANEVIEALKVQFKDARQSNLDGLSVRYPNWWFNLRGSHTEPVVRLVVEARDASALAGCERLVLDVVRRYEHARKS